jgi:hypothetical protein
MAWFIALLLPPWAKMRPYYSSRIVAQKTHDHSSAWDVVSKLPYRMDLALLFHEALT